MFNSDFDTEMPQGGGRHRRAELRAALRAAAADAGPRGPAAPLALRTPACRGTNLADRVAFFIFAGQGDTTAGISPPGAMTPSRRPSWRLYVVRSRLYQFDSYIRTNRFVSSIYSEGTETFVFIFRRWSNSSKYIAPNIWRAGH